jgi:hypothetical protein
MAYTDDFTLSQDVTFQGRIRMSMIKTAIIVQAQVPSSDAVIDAKRSALAVAVLSSPYAYVLRFTLAAIEGEAVFSSNPLTSGSTDAAIDGVLALIWNSMAGVTTRD